MEQIIVTHLDGSTLKLQSKENVSSITRATQTVELLGQDVVDITVESATKLSFYLGDKIEIIGRDYTLNNPPKEHKLSESHFVYDLQFEGVQYDLLRACYNVNVDTTSNQIQDLNGDSLTGDLRRFLDVLISNANRVFPGTWYLGTCPENTETRTETFGDSDNCLSVLQSLCSEDKYNTEFSIEIDAFGNRTINIGATGNTFPFTFEYGVSKGFYDLTRQKVSSSNIVTRLNVFGSSRNINTSKYRAFKLCLPAKSKAQSFIENATAIAKYGVWENTKNFEDIYPHRKGVVSALGVDELTFTDTTMDFDLNAKDGNENTLYLIAGNSAKIHFNTGNLAGYDFEVVSYTHSTKTFVIRPFTDENGYTFPSATSGAFRFSQDDEYVLLDIYMPASYITAAESALQTAGQAYLNKYSQPLVSYGLSVDPLFLKRIVGEEADSNTVWAGDYIPIKDTDLDVDKTIRVKGFTRDLLQDYSYNLTIADLPITVSTVTRVISELKGLDNVVKINNLNDPARARRNYRATSELVDMIETVKTEALLVGNDPASQFDLVGVSIRANYNKNANTIDISAGTINHYYYPVGTPGTWTISAGNFTGLTPAGTYYVYIKASKSTATAVYYLANTKIGVEDVGGFYHFPVGVLSSVIDGARVFTSTKGYTLITGDSIKTGRISSNDGTHYFDLTTGEFKGDFKFTSGVSVETAVANAATAASNAQETADNIQVGSVNLYKKTTTIGGLGNTPTIEKEESADSINGFQLTGVNGVQCGVRLYNVIDANGEYTVSFWLKSNGTGDLALNMCDYAPISGHKAFTTEWQYFVYKFNVTNYSADVYNFLDIEEIPWVYLWFKNFKIEKGNIATDWSPSPSDVDARLAALDYLKAALTGSTEISGGLVGTNVILLKTLAGLVTGGMSGLADDNIGFWTGGTYDQAISNLAKIILRKDGSGQLAAGKIMWDLFGALNVGNFKIEGGAIVGYADTKDKIKLHTGAIPSLASLPGSWVTANDVYNVAPETNPFGTTYRNYDTILPAYFTELLESGGSLTVPANTTIKLYATQEPVMVFEPTTAVISSEISHHFEIHLGNTLIGTYTPTQTGYSVNLATGGTYSIKYVVETLATVKKSGTCRMTLTQDFDAYITYQLAVERTEIGKDGFYSYWSNLMYMYYNSATGLEIKGVTDIPGVLASGSISSGGIHTNPWGAKKNTSNATYTATGIYDVPHSAGSTYQVMVMPIGDGQNGFVVSKGNNTFRVQIRNNSGNAAAGAFDYIIIGSN